MKNRQVDAVGTPRKGNYQYSIGDSILGYCDSKEKAKELASARAMEWVMRVSDSCMWYVGEVIELEHKTSTQKYQRIDGSGTYHWVDERKIAVAVSVVAFGCVSSTTIRSESQAGLAQGKAR
jgi:hypothetical protein